MNKLQAICELEVSEIKEMKGTKVYISFICLSRAHYIGQK